jgi:hypothetical protein
MMRLQMGRFVDELASLDDFIGSDGISSDVVEKAEAELGLRFAADYREYLLCYGIAAANGHELTGLGSSQRLNVVEKTLSERKKSGHCENLYVIEDTCIDHLIIWQSPSGKVFSTLPGEDPVIMAHSLLEYLAS